MVQYKIMHTMTTLNFVTIRMHRVMNSNFFLKIFMDINLYMENIIFQKPLE